MFLEFLKWCKFLHHLILGKKCKNHTGIFIVDYGHYNVKIHFLIFYVPLPHIFESLFFKFIPLYYYFFSVIPVLNLTVNGSSKDMDITEDSYVHLLCSISANPAVYDITWYFRKQPIRTIEPLGILITNQTLVIERAKREHSGSYHCSAENFVNRGTSNSVHLTIKCV